MPQPASTSPAVKTIDKLKDCGKKWFSHDEQINTSKRHMGMTVREHLWTTINLGAKQIQKRCFRPCQSHSIFTGGMGTGNLLHPFGAGEQRQTESACLEGYDLRDPSLWLGWAHLCPMEQSLKLELRGTK